MAIRSLARSGVAGGKYVNFLAGNDPFSPDSDFLIEEQVLGTAAATVTFSSIPSTYKHLQIRIVGQGSSGSYELPFLRFNADTGSNYANHYLYSDGGTIASAAEANSSYVWAGWLSGSGIGSTNFGASVIDILDYSSTAKNKTVRSLAGMAYSNTNRRVQFASGHWRNTAAVSSITLGVLATASFSAGSRFSLYGSNG